MSMGKGGFQGPNTRAPGGQGRDYNGNARGSNMPGEFFIGGVPRPIGGPAPIFGGRPAPGDLYRQPPGGMPMPGVMPPQQGGGRFTPRGMIPPAGGRIGNPRQVNPGQGPMQPGMPVQPPSFGGGKGGFGGPQLDMLRSQQNFFNGNSAPVYEDQVDYGNTIDSTATFNR